MEKAIKYVFMTLVSLVVLFIVVLFVGVLFISGESKNIDDNKREFATEALVQIVSYSNENGHYPETLKDLPLYSDQKFKKYVNDLTFRYDSQVTDKSNFVLYWRDGAMDWTGNRCSNDRLLLSEDLKSAIRTDNRPGGIVCVVTDLH